MTIKISGIFIKILPIVALSIFGLFLYLNGEGNADKFRNSIYKNLGLANGYVYRTNHLAKRGEVIHYSFEVNGNVHHGRVSGPQYEKLGSKIIRHAFPVVFNKDSIELNEILILPENFEDFNINFPDSLNWLLSK